MEGLMSMLASAYWNKCLTALYDVIQQRARSFKTTVSELFLDLPGGRWRHLKGAYFKYSNRPY